MLDRQTFLGRVLLSRIIAGLLAFAALGAAFIPAPAFAQLGVYVTPPVGVLPEHQGFIERANALSRQMNRDAYGDPLSQPGMTGAGCRDLEALDARYDTLLSLQREIADAQDLARTRGSPGTQASLDEVGRYITQLADGWRNVLLRCRPPPPMAADPLPELPEVALARRRVDEAIGACDRALFEGAKARLDSLYGELIQEETDPARREALTRERAAAASRIFPEPCPPTQDGPVEEPGILGETADNERLPDRAPPPPPPPPPAAEAPPPAPRVSRSSLFGARANVTAAINACDRGAFDAAKDRLDALYEQLIREEPDLERRQALIRERGAAWSRAFPDPCPPDRRTGMNSNFGESEWRNAAFVAAGYATLEVPAANYGFVTTGSSGPEGPAARSEEHVSGAVFTAGAAFGPLSVQIQYLQGQADTEFAIPVLGSGGASGIVNTDNAPSGSTGVTGNFGTFGATQVAVDSFTGAVTYDVIDHRGAGRLRGFVGASLDYADQHHLGEVHIAGIAGGDFSFNVDQDLDQQITERRGGVIAGLDYAVPLGSGLRAEIGAQASVQLYSFDLTSVETRAQNIGPSSDQAFTNRIEDQADGVGYAGTVRAALAYPIGPAEIFVAGEVSYTSDRGQVVNPSSGTFVQEGGTTFLDTVEAVDTRVTIGLRFALGAPPPP